ncbi:histidine kinase dimerization/phospho-acceptor domain-containing protein [Metabacillus herbersteinensis]|uniref:histidine kinase n=1 Tax=Metabacillus herbersteinensis TaxID=283816 RepID=A0ABV6GK13_9BACI
MVYDQKRENELNQLRKENRLLKELVSELPFSFTYEHQQYGLRVEKAEGKSEPLIENSHSKNSANQARDPLTITSEISSFQQTEALLSLILDSVPHHIVFIDQLGIITLCNLEAANDLGINRDKIIGKHIRELLNIPDEQIVTLETIRTGKEIVDREILDRNYGIINTRIIKNNDGSIMRVIGTFHFLNAIKEAEKQALAGRIAAGIAHEIRNPLTTVRGYLQFLSGKIDKETAELFTNLLITEIDRANKIISEFLTIAKPVQTKTEQLNIKVFLEDYLGRLLHSESLLYNIDLNYLHHPSTEQMFIKADRDELHSN